MSLRGRIQTITFVCLIAVLMVYSLVIYVFFVRVSTDAEVRLLWNRAQTILRTPEIRQPSLWKTPSLLEEFLSERTMVRIIEPGGKVLAQALNDPVLEQLTPVYRTAYHTGITAKWTLRIISIQVPILSLPDKQQVGSLELSKSFSLVQGYLRLLLITVSVCFAVGVLFSILIAITYVRWIYKPIAALAGTMERIEQEGTFERLSPDFTRGRDEFSSLGRIFNRMISRLEDNYNRQRRFVADASHELRTPLTVISSYAGMLRRWGGHDERLRNEAVEAIEQESHRLKELVDGLLQLANLKTSTDQVGGAPAERVDLGELVRRTASELSRALNRKIIVETGSRTDRNALMVLEGNPIKLKQLLIILLDNAIKYSSKSVTVRTEVLEDELLLQVADRGIGIAEEHIEHLFDRFYRADPARNRRTGGSGLGLAIAREIVMEHGGEITIASKEGAGTTVTVKLPKNAKTAL